ncbi:DUF1203 domain-containing protein [Acanthopleuribacter pedis]|uniref:DUF1203 domain-containing protein n=1 Tax=Acanthopleuribacter pedis TaxID=442870 RepID=A0A8J7Q4I3_9BACT|nr:DUF1203 domain-containing protein [Acanthopleuribacter pedis]MBO1318024.1 DUF1203 domain-containing protein [Acanthopleuribacter pedis]
MAHFRVMPLPSEPFEALFKADQATRAKQGAITMVADTKPGYPCRIRLQDAEPGERLLLVNYEHQSADNPYRACHAVFVTLGAVPTYPAPDQVPAMLSGRMLSVRAFDMEDMMVDAEVVAGEQAGNLFSRWLARAEVGYLHVHSAKRGCFLARVVAACVTH